MCMDREQERCTQPRARVGTYSHGKFTFGTGWEFEEPVYAYSHEQIDREFDSWRRGAEKCIRDEQKLAQEVADIEQSRANAHKELDEGAPILGEN